jgi:hypothetical protein
MTMNLQTACPWKQALGLVCLHLSGATEPRTHYRGKILDNRGKILDPAGKRDISEILDSTG